MGYGAEGITSTEPGFNGISGKPIPAFVQYRKFFLSMDVDFTRIPTRSKVLKGVFTVLSLIKIPFPAIEYNSLGDVNFYYLYF